MAKEKYWELVFCDGSFDGLVKCSTKRHVTYGYRLSADKLDSIGKAHKSELEKSGIYFICERRSWNSNRNSHPHMYVGQSKLRKNKDAMLNRVKEHRKEMSLGKLAWQDEIVFIVPPDNFGATELNYLEHRFYELGVSSGRYDFSDQNDPHASDISPDMEEPIEDFIEDVKYIMAAFGYLPFLGSANSEVERCATAGDPSALFSFSGANANASGFPERLRDDPKKVFFTVVKGSIISDHVVKSFKEYVRSSFDMRNRLCEDGTIVDRVFMRDYRFESPSKACDVVSGRSSNGWKEWTDVNGHSLREVFGVR